MARKRYLKKTPLREARELFLERIDTTQLASETLPTREALSRVTEGPVFAKLSSPHYHGSAMDGICVRAEDTFGATEFSPKAFTLVCLFLSKVLGDDDCVRLRIFENEEALP